MKRTLYFGNPAYLSCRLDQLLVDRRSEKGIPEDTPIQSVPLEDVGLIVLDHKQITLTHATLQACNERNIALLSCASNHMPGGLMQPFFWTYAPPGDFGSSTGVQQAFAEAVVGANRSSEATKPSGGYAAF